MLYELDFSGAAVDLKINHTNIKSIQTEGIPIDHLTVEDDGRSEQLSVSWSRSDYEARDGER